MGSTHQRPAPFPPGTRLSEHFTIEGLVRLSEGRMFYLANDDRPDQQHRHCWDCGSDESPRGEIHCASCGAEFGARRFLVSARWDADNYDSYQAFCDRKLEHPGLVPVINVLVQDGILCSVTAWNGETLLVDEGSPLDHDRLLDLSTRGIGLLAFMQHNGIELAPLSAANFVRLKSGEFMFFDLNIAQVDTAPLGPERCIPGIASLAQVLRRLTAVKALALQKIFQDAETGAFTRPIDFGRAVENVLKAQPASDDPLSNGRALVAAMTDVGLLRVLNEDNWNWKQLSDDIFLYVAADGMGGHECGEVASQMAVDTICRVAMERLEGTSGVTAETLENVLDEAFQSANNSIKDHSEQLGNDMGTTLTAAAIYKDELALVANVGDSRGYLMREQVLHQITRDHSLVARMVEQNRLSPEEARTHPHSNILLRTVGTERNVEIDIFSVELEPGDRLLLCSDGLWGEIEDQDIEAILNHYTDPRVVCREMIRAAHHGGGRDNITVLVVEVP